MADDLLEVVFNRPLWQSFTYSVPQHLSGGDMRGCRVVAPFGKQKLIGYVWGISSPNQRSGIELKPIIDRLDSLPLLSTELLDLVRWAAEYYFAPPGMMMAAAQPPGTMGRAERVVRLLEPLGDDNPLKSLIPSSREVRVGVLRDNLDSGFPLERELAELESDGNIRVVWRSVSAPKPMRERVISAELVPDKLIRMAESIRHRAPRQAEILVQLAAAGSELPRKQLLRAAGANSSSLGSLLEKGIVSEKLRRKYREPIRGGNIENGAPPPELTPDQSEVLGTLLGALHRHGVFLLHGVTGSGKTEIYLRAIEAVLDNGGSALVMVPEISLTPLTVSRFSRRFPGQTAVLHSGMSAGERLDGWNLIRTGERRIAIGPRSAVFSPLSDLGIIVVDEEHDGSYKQDELPHYNGRDLAVLRGKQLGIPVILGSASPSMESFGNAQAGKYSLLRLSKRVDGTPMPGTMIVEQPREKDRLISQELCEGIEKRISSGEQTILLINRRGFSPTQMCRNCGYREECPNCGVTLTYHRKGQLLKCHYCDYWKAAMRNCPRCGFNEFSHMGPGIQKVEEQLETLLPGISIIRMDADTTRSKDAHWQILGDFASGRGDVLLGTQMVAKGHDFPNVTLVGIVSADMGLAFPDFRAAERTFQLILQVAGRAGRGMIPGEVIVQSLDTKDATVRAASEHDFLKFWEMEKTVRKAFGYPPFGHLVRFLWSGLRKGDVQRVANENCTCEGIPGTELSQPMEAAFPRINRRWRFSAVARSPERKLLARTTRMIRKKFSGMKSAGVRLDIDVDPYNLL